MIRGDTAWRGVRLAAVILFILEKSAPLGWSQRHRAGRAAPAQAPRGRSAAVRWPAVCAADVLTF